MELDNKKAVCRLKVIYNPLIKGFVTQAMQYLKQYTDFLFQLLHIYLREHRIHKVK